MEIIENDKYIKTDNFLKISKEKSMKEILHFFNAAVNTIENPVFIKDKHGKFLMLNDAFSRLSGYSKEELTGKTDFEFFEDDIAYEFKKIDDMVLKTEKIYTDTGIFIDKTGKKHIIKTKKYCFRDIFSKKYIVAILEDITEYKKTEESLLQKTREIENQGMFRKILLEELGEAGIGILIIEKGKILYVNFIGFVQTTEFTVDELKEKTHFIELLHPDDRLKVIDIHENRISGRMAPSSYEVRMLKKSGGIIDTKIIANIIPNSEPVQTVVIMRDVTESNKIKKDLEKREREFRAVVETTPDTIARYDRDCQRIYTNPALIKLSGMLKNELLNMPPGTNLTDSKQAADYKNTIKEVFETGKENRFTLKWFGRNKNIVSDIRIVPEFDNEGNVVSVLSIGRDITEIDEYKQKIYNMAYYDSLTNLPNRVLFNERLKEILAEAKTYGHNTGLMLLDLDNFKGVNDTMGHSMGDCLITEVGTRLNKIIHTYDILARLGGDEFVFIIHKIKDEYDMINISEKILCAFDSPFFIGGREIFITSSIGIALYPKDSTNSDDLFKCADSALYHAKAMGRNNVQFYNPEQTLHAAEFFELSASLRKVLENNELELFYQPQIDLSNKKIKGAEALLRWNHPEKGLIMPDKFIKIMEETGIIIEVGEWIFREGCKEVVRWNKNSETEYKVAINVSGYQFKINSFINMVENILFETECRPQWIEIEITESILLEDNYNIKKILSYLRNMGITIAIDDFGTGYSALGYINRFPIDVIKIDRSFVKDISESASSAGLIKAIIVLAENINLKLVAEGVETIEQEKLLCLWKCHTAQGYLYSKPVCKREFEKIIFGD